MQRNEAELSMYHFQIDCLIQNCKIFNFLHLTFLLILLILNIFLLSSNIPQIVNYSIFNFVAIVFYLIPPLVVGYRLIYVKQNYEQNEHCFSNFIVLLFYLHENDELKIINYVNCISSYIQLLALLYYEINNFPLKLSGILTFLLQFFYIFYIINIVLTSLRIILYQLNVVCRTICCYGRNIQYYIYQKGYIYDSVIKTTIVFLCLLFFYCLAKFVACMIIFTITDKVIIILSNSVMIAISLVQSVLIYKLFITIQIFKKSQILMKFNHYCFENYWILTYSLLTSKELIIFQHRLFGLYFIQAGFAVGIYFQNIDVNFQYYVVLDSFVTFVFVILLLISVCLRLCIGHITYWPIFIQQDERYLREYMQKMEEYEQKKKEQEIENQIQKNQERNEIQEQLNCCICLQQIEEPQPKKRLKCDYRHQFHVQCINQWLSYNSVCPLCQQGVQH